MRDGNTNGLHTARFRCDLGLLLPGTAVGQKGGIKPYVALDLAPPNNRAGTLWNRAGVVASDSRETGNRGQPTANIRLQLPIASYFEGERERRLAHQTSRGGGGRGRREVSAAPLRKNKRYVEDGTKQDARLPSCTPGMGVSQGFSRMHCRRPEGQKP